MQTTEHHGWVNVWMNEDHGLPFLMAVTHYSLALAMVERQISCSGNKKTLINRFEFTWEQ
jgi:hypothetical protein